MPRKYYWCIVKRVPIREEPDDSGRETGCVQFGQRIKILTKCKSPYVMISLHNYEDGSNTVGWANRKAFTSVQVEDYAGLFYENHGEYALPTKLRYYGEPQGRIAPGEIVRVIAKAGDFCLTNRGWTRFCWLTKCRDVFDQETLDALFMAVLAQAVKDYRNVSTRLKKGKYSGYDDYCDLVWRHDDITRWFTGKEYSLMFDAVPGQERLRDLNSELGIDDSWVNDHRTRMELFLQKGLARKKH